MTKRLIRLLPVIFALGVFLALFSGLQREPQKLVQAANNRPVPAFSLTTLKQPKNTLTHALFDGEIVLLNVWASWCPICIKEFPFLLEVAASTPSVKFYGLNYRDQRSLALDTLEKYGNPFLNTIYDPAGKLALELGVYGTPDTYLINRKGEIIFRYTGELNRTVWQEHFIPHIQQLQKTTGEEK